MTKVRTIRVLIFCLAAALGLFVLIGFSGTFIPAGDSAAVVRPQASILLFISAASLWALKARFPAFLSIIIASFALNSVLSTTNPSEVACNGACITLYQKNLLSKAWPRYSLADDIVSSGAEIAMLQEVSNHNRRFMARMFEHFPTQLICDFRPAQQVAILTSLPAIEETKYCLADVGLAGIQVEAPNGELIWLVSIHLPWPYPHDQYRQSQTIADWLTKLDHPVLIAGDFNMVPWGASVQRIQDAVGNRRLGAFRNTYRSGSFMLPLPIDSVLIPKELTGSTELRPYLGSDHLGVLAQIALR